jgi:hypothetical protein
MTVNTVEQAVRGRASCSPGLPDGRVVRTASGYQAQEFSIIPVY